MKAAELLQNPELIKKVKGFIWHTQAPPAVFNYQGELLKISEDKGLCQIEFQVRKVKGISNGYDLKPCTKLTLIFKNGNIRFYANKKESQALFKEALKETDGLFGEECRKNWKKCESSA